MKALRNAVNEALFRLCAAGVAKTEEGQGLVEYGLVLTFVAVAAIVGLTALGSDINGFFEALPAKLGLV